MVTAFKKVDGVTEATTDLKSGTATVTYDPKKTKIETIIAGLKDTEFVATLTAEQDKKEPEKKAN